MELGAFSVSLAVQDIERSRAFYTTLGFEPIGGVAAQAVSTAKAARIAKRMGLPRRRSVAQKKGG